MSTVSSSSLSCYCHAKCQSINWTTWFIQPRDEYDLLQFMVSLAIKISVHILATWELFWSNRGDLTSGTAFVATDKMECYSACKWLTVPNNTWHTVSNSDIRNQIVTYCEATVNLILDQATKAQRGSRGISLLLI